METFDHEKLEVYQAALEFMVMANDIVELMPRGKGYLANQLQRAATSIPLNIAEGAGEFSSKEKARFYRIARRSATECAAIIDLCYRVKLIEAHNYQPSRTQLLRIVSMLTKLTQAFA